jgi:hypothetical protein
MYHYGTNNLAVRQLGLGLPSHLGSKLSLRIFCEMGPLCLPFVLYHPYI